MKIVGEEFLRTCIAEEGFFLKLILNEQVAHFFPYTTEHRDATLPGVCYRDDSAGDAIAATIKPFRIDFRRHKDFSAERVKRLVQTLQQVVGRSENSTQLLIYYASEELTNLCI